MPQADRGTRVIASPSGQLNAYFVGLGFCLSAARQTQRHIADHIAKLTQHLNSCDGRQQDAWQLRGILKRDLFTHVLTQGMGHLMAHHRSQFAVCELKLGDDAGIDPNLATGHAKSIHLIALKDIDLPAPTAGVFTKDPGLCDQTTCDFLYTCVHGGITIQLAFGTGLLHQFAVSLG